MDRRGFFRQLRGLALVAVAPPLITRVSSIRQPRSACVGVDQMALFRNGRLIAAETFDRPIHLLDGDSLQLTWSFRPRS